MAVQTKEVLKSYFNTFDRPNESQFVDLIDSLQRQVFYDVKDYGAIGDGIADDTQQIQAAIDAASSTGGQVIFPQGIFRILGPINIYANNVSLIGSGAGATILRAANAKEDIAMIVIGNGVTTCAHTTVAKMLIDSVNEKTANQAIKLDLCFKTWLYELRLEKQYNGIYAINSTQTYLRDSDIRDTKNDAIIWESSPGYDFYINNVVADNPNSNNVGNGINWLGGENFVIHNCDFLNFNVGLNIHPETGKQCRFGFFSAAEFDFASDNCIKITSEDGGDVVGINFTTTWSGTATNYGVLISDGTGLVQGIRFVSHKSMHNGLAGIRLAGGMDIHILGCDVIGNSQTVSGSRSGIEVSSNMGDNWSIIGSRIGNGYQQGNTQDHGISLDSGSYSNVAIIGNDVATNISDGISLNGSTFSNAKIFANNGNRIEILSSNATPELWLENTNANHISKIYDDGNLHIEGEGQNIWINGASVADILLALGGGKVSIGAASGNSVFSITGLPTSATGLVSGDIWNNGGILTIVS